jgi:hypothetical protein
MAGQLKRDPAAVHKHLFEQDDGSIVTDAHVRIQIPERYTTRHLASIGTEVYILAFFSLIVNDQFYTVSETAAMIRITPSSTERVTIRNTAYIEFSFFPGDRVFYGIDLVKNDTLTYYIYDEHVAKGNMPWSFNYFDMLKLFETAEEYAGINLGNRAVPELIISTMGRNADDFTQLYKHVLQDYSDVDERPPAVVPFRSVIWNTSDTTSKLIGSYFSDSITSALVNPSERVERIEELLRT